VLAHSAQELLTGGVAQRGVASGLIQELDDLRHGFPLGWLLKLRWRSRSPQHPDTRLWSCARSRRTGGKKTQPVAYARHGGIGAAILHRNGRYRQCPECRVDENAQRFARQPAPARRTHQHDAEFVAACIDGRPDRTQAYRSRVAAFGDGEEKWSGRFPPGAERGAQARRRIGVRERSADMAHGFGVAIKLAEQRQVAACERAQTHTPDHARGRAIFTNRRNVLSSGIARRAGGNTSVSGASMRAVASLRSVMVSIRGAWIGSVAAR